MAHLNTLQKHERPRQKPARDYLIRAMPASQLNTPLHLNPRRLMRQTAFCDPQTPQVFCGSRKQFSCQPTEAQGFERCPTAVNLYNQRGRKAFSFQT